MKNLAVMKNLASIHILHLPSGTHLYTVEEKTPSYEEAKMQLSKLAEVISSLSQDNHSIVLETTEGYVVLPRKVLSESILHLQFTQVENESGFVSGEGKN